MCICNMSSLQSSFQEVYQQVMRESKVQLNNHIPLVEQNLRIYDLKQVQALSVHHSGETRLHVGYYFWNANFLNCLFQVLHLTL
uniref:Uncharacterized protein n=1 Tax=Anguilla anguilla TaxID=7936 RepID=A0A0E9WDX3_ANGAN